MKRKRQPAINRRPMRESQRSPTWLSIILGAAIPVLVVTAVLYHLPARFILPPVVFLIWIWGSLLLWQRANAHATGDEWWQDDDCSGWRGY